MATILLVEDNTDVRDMMSVALELDGHTVWTACHGMEALAVLHRRRPDLVLLDLMMPVMNGWELRSEMAGNPRFVDIPVVIISAVTADVVDRLRDEVYIPKPVDLDELLDVVRECSGGAIAERRR